MIVKLLVAGFILPLGGEDLVFDVVGKRGGETAGVGLRLQALAGIVGH